MYIVVMWPESQKLVDLDGFEDHCYLVNDKRGLEDFGSSAYFVDKFWYESIFG